MSNFIYVPAELSRYDEGQLDTNSAINLDIIEYFDPPFQDEDGMWEILFYIKNGGTIKWTFLFEKVAWGIFYSILAYNGKEINVPTTN